MLNDNINYSGFGSAMSHENKIVRELFQIMEEELNILERKVDLIKKLKNASGKTWNNLRKDKEFQILARKYHPLNDDDIIAAWTRKISRSRVM